MVSPSPGRKNSEIYSSDSDEFEIKIINPKEHRNSSTDIMWSPPKTLNSISSPVPNQEQEEFLIISEDFRNHVP